ncbi:MAG TPA: protein translocase subunit SecF [Gemmatimonadales bacterium]|nr:protein translocase subunit SecF [Gemmatimonadales bacterium]
MRFFAHANYDFLAARRFAIGVVLALVVPGFVMLLLRGINYSIEFTGGTMVRFTTQEVVGIGAIRQALDAQGVTGAEIITFGSDREYVIRAMVTREGSDANDTAAALEAVTAALDQAVGAGAYSIGRSGAVGPKVGSELRSQAAILVVLSLVAVLIYLAYRFEWRFGVAAVVATLHDVLATIAFIGLLRLEVSLFVVGAILSIVGYSLNDTIVVLDRVRENLHKFQRADFAGLLNRSINETLPRTVFTGTTALGSLVALAVLGGDVVRPFALVMLWGVLVGTFSSIWIASPVLLWIEQRWPGPQARGVRPAAGTKAPPPPARRPQPVA